MGDTKNRVEMAAGVWVWVCGVGVGVGWGGSDEESKEAIRRYMVQQFSFPSEEECDC